MCQGEAVPLPAPLQLLKSLYLFTLEFAKIPIKRDYPNLKVLVSLAGGHPLTPPLAASATYIYIGEKMPTLGAYVNDEIYEKIKEIADSKNLTVSKVVKLAIEKIQIADQSVEIKKINELHRIGNNLNQIAKYCNTKKTIDRQVLKQLVEIESDIKSLL